MNKSTSPQFNVFAKRKNSNDLNADLYLRITYLDNKHEKSLGIKCLYRKWIGDKNIVQGDPVTSHQLKLLTEELIQKTMGAFHMLAQQDGVFSIKDIVEVAFEQRKPGALSFCQCFNDMIFRMAKSKGLEGSSETNLQKHKRCLVHFQKFALKYYGSSDLPFTKINRITIDEMLDYLRGEGNCSHNTAIKYLQIIKKVYRSGMDNGWVKVNAFANFKMKIRTVDRAFLFEEELNKIQETHFDNPRLDHVKDMFVFSCFSGLAYIDVKNLRRQNIIENNGMLWIKSKRTKTGIEASIPLLPPAKAILDRRSPGWLNLSKTALLLNIISNQKMNAYLKEIANRCDIDKTITFHLARHTFATTVSLLNDVPIETISKMLGHSRITMTQHYSKVIDLKIARDTEKLIEKYK